MALYVVVVSKSTKTVNKERIAVIGTKLSQLIFFLFFFFFFFPLFFVNSEYVSVSKVRTNKQRVVFLSCFLFKKSDLRL